jgi:predicted enzyme related to lactoylglutathione lyase
LRFTIEQRHLTDDAGKLVGRPDAVTFHVFEAEDADAAVRLFIRRDGGEILGDIRKFPGFQAVATVRQSGGVYTLQVSPTSQRFAIC